MTIREGEEKLFEEWEKHWKEQTEKVKEDLFLDDGVVNEEEYKKSHPKILFVLKEVSNKEKDNKDSDLFDLREFLAGKPCGRDGTSVHGQVPTWSVATRWLRSIRARDKELNWEKIKHVSGDDRVEQLKSIAVMNLKKSPGYTSTDRKKLIEATKRDAKYISKQFDLYKPDLAICCGDQVIELLTDARYQDGKKPDMTSTTRGVPYYQHSPGYTIDYYHPQARGVKHYMLHYSLVDAVDEILSL